MRDLNIAGLLLLIFLFGGCRQESNKNMNNSTENTNKPAQIRYLALGDSYTIGEGVEAGATFPALLSDSLMLHYNIAVSFEIIAKTGWSSGQLLSAIEAKKPEPPYELVSLLIGVNNQYRGLDTAQYRAEFRRLLLDAIGFAGNEKDRIIVLSIPDYGVTPFAANMNSELIAEEINAFNAINFDETQKAGASYVDVTGISRLAADDSSLLAADGLHPSPVMYRQWVDAMFPLAVKIFNE
jgi:lysophospholipase L1-like esterase